MSRYKLSYLGSGAYNSVYCLLDEKDNKKILGVLKCQKITIPSDPDLPEDLYLDTCLDTIERSIKVWNEINPTMPAEVFKERINGLFYQGWVCPYVEGRQATDLEIARTLIDIYTRTGRIVLDAVGNRNVLTKPDGQCICIDIGYAVKLDHEYGPLPRIKDVRFYGERTDFAGVARWRDMQLAFRSYFECIQPQMPLSVNVIKALLFISRHKPDLRSLDFLMDGKIATQLAEAYDQELRTPESFIKEPALTAIEKIEHHSYPSLTGVGFFTDSTLPSSVDHEVKSNAFTQAH